MTLVKRACWWSVIGFSIHAAKRNISYWLRRRLWVPRRTTTQQGSWRRRMISSLALLIILLHSCNFLFCTDRSCVSRQTWPLLSCGDSSEDSQLNLCLLALGRTPPFLDLYVRHERVVGDDVGLHAAPWMLAHPERTWGSCPHRASSRRATRRSTWVDQ